MSNYTKATNFATKDALTTGNPLKTLSGTELDDEFNAISVASATKANANNAELTGSYSGLRHFYYTSGYYCIRNCCRRS